MTSILDSAHTFLHQHGMHPDDLDMHLELQKLRQNIERALSGSVTPSGCQMLPAFVTLGRSPTPDEHVLALDIGGTNLRAALVSFSSDGSSKIENLISRPVPGLDKPLSKEEFLREIVLFSAPLAQRANHLGVCFSYQARITPDGDGEVILFGKEVHVNNSSGMLVCRELLDTFSAHGITNLRAYSLVNDTVAAMLGGSVQFKGRCDGVLGFILGTGTNLCYQAKSKHIPLLHSSKWSASSMVMNIESGVYSGFPQGTFDRIVDKNSMSPGTYGNEKMVGGVYQGEVLYHTLCNASYEGLFSPSFCNNIRKAKSLSSIDLSEFISHPSGTGLLSRLCADENDRHVLYVFVRCLLERAAKLVVTTLAAPMEMEDMGRNDHALIVAEGSTFWKNETLHSMIQHHAKQFIGNELGRHFSFFGAENPNLIGAALSVFQK